MFRQMLTAVAAVELLSPDALVGAAERIALKNPEDCELKPWVGPVARSEGLVIVVLLWRSDDSYATLKKFLGLVGLLAFLFPRAYVEYGSELAYADAADCEWKPWVYPGTRLVGAAYVLLALDELLGE